MPAPDPGPSPEPGSAPELEATIESGPAPADGPVLEALARADALDDLETEARDVRDFRLTTRLLAVLGWVVWSVAGGGGVPVSLLLIIALAATVLGLVVEGVAVRSLRGIEARRSELAWPEDARRDGASAAGTG